MKDIMFDELNEEFIQNINTISAVEKNYDYYEITVWNNDKLFRILDTRNSRCSDLIFTDAEHEENHARYIIKKLGGNPDEIMHQRFNHNPACWDDDCSDYDDNFDGYYGDGLDNIEELYYMD